MTRTSTGRLAQRWSALAASNRRRIVLGLMVALAVAAWDLLLFVVAASLFLLSELAPTPRAGPRPS